ncbi:MAG: DUF4290 domain-containing protein [Bacteroidales bacterium]|nr:DUF4290 domain-containing protein [Bacteroidales bacterium]
MLEYNTARNHLLIRTYGRNIQKMIENVVSISDKEQRNEAAKALIKVMAQLNPENSSIQNSVQKDPEDYLHQLWDHLFIISDFKLDVDAPFPIPDKNAYSEKNISSQYKKKPIVNRTYGRNIQNIVKIVSAYPQEQREELIPAIANYLKKLYLCYNQDSVKDYQIVNQLREMSEGKLLLSEDFEFVSTKEILKINNAQKLINNPPVFKKNKKKKKKKSPMDYTSNEHKPNEHKSNEHKPTHKPNDHRQNDHQPKENRPVDNRPVESKQ